MDACMNKEQQVPEQQQAAKSAIKHAKEKERVHTAHKYIDISSDSSSSLSSDESSETSSDDSSDLVTSQKPTKLVMSSNKSSTFLAKRKSDNEETYLKQPHQDVPTQKQNKLERIKCLRIKCGCLDSIFFRASYKLVKSSRSSGC